MKYDVAPANEQVEYVFHQFQRSRGEDKTPFQGWPTDDIDKVWQDSYVRKFITYIPRGPT